MAFVVNFPVCGPDLQTNNISRNLHMYIYIYRYVMVCIMIIVILNIINILNIILDINTEPENDCIQNEAPKIQGADNLR